jgi:hypothetical protein
MTAKNHQFNIPGRTEQFEKILDAQIDDLKGEVYAEHTPDFSEQAPSHADILTIGTRLYYIRKEAQEAA